MSSLALKGYLKRILSTPICAIVSSLLNNNIKRRVAEIHTKFQQSNGVKRYKKKNRALDKKYKFDN